MTEGAREQSREVGGRSTHAVSWLAWLLAGLSVAMFFASIPLYLLARDAHVPSSWDADLSVGGLLLRLPFMAFPLVGALIASRHPRNPIGWILLATGLLWMLNGMLNYYGFYGVARPGSLPFLVEMAGLNNWLWVFLVGLPGTFLVLLFPEGRLLSRRWRPLG